MKLQQILCPIDYSEFSEIANFYASMFAQATGAELLYLHAVWPPLLDSSIEGEQAAMLTEFAARVRPLVRGIEARYELGFGDPSKQIVEMAVKKKVDLIVMGTHGRTGSRRLLHGSVCENVLRHAPCAVLAVKPTPTADSAPQAPSASRLAGPDAGN